jgi:hypothetical protein
MTVMTRVGYCPVCAEKRRPKRGQLFLYLANGTNEEYDIGSLSKVEIGITPHLYILIKTDGKFVYYKSLCLMDGCGTKREKDDKKEWLMVDETKVSRLQKTTIKNWNALVMLKDYWNEEVEKKW